MGIRAAFFPTKAQREEKERLRAQRQAQRDSPKRLADKAKSAISSGYYEYKSLYTRPNKNPRMTNQQLKEELDRKFKKGRSYVLEILPEETSSVFTNGVTIRILTTEFYEKQAEIRDFLWENFNLTKRGSFGIGGGPDRDAKQFLATRQTISAKNVILISMESSLEFGAGAHS
tara:strand:+ start:670 stop:1188 length:519 start_codon:yes stop_codon:yes gene_type:complete